MKRIPTNLLCIVLLGLTLISMWTVANPVAAAVPVFCHAQEELDSEEILSKVQNVMDDADFRAVRSRANKNKDNKGFLDSMLDKLAPKEPDRGVQRSGSGTPSTGSAAVGALSRFLLVIVILIIFLVLGLIAFVIARTVDFSANKKAAAPFVDDAPGQLAISAPPGEVAVNEYERRALEMAAAGNYAGAIRELLLGSMSWIERRGLIRFRTGLTNRDYLRAVWRLQSQRTAFDSNALEFEKVYFGRRDATQSVFHSCLQQFRGAFHEEAVISPTL